LDELVVFDVRASGGLGEPARSGRLIAPGLRVSRALDHVYVARGVLVVWHDETRAARRPLNTAALDRLASEAPTLDAIATLTRSSSGGVWLEPATRRLWCWRGGVGAQPWRMYQAAPGTWWLTPSSSLLTARGVRTPDPARLAQFICGAEGDAAEDYLSGVSRLVPGRCVVLSAAGAQHHALPAPSQQRPASDVLSVIEEALGRIHGWSELPLHLSAGLDSATLLGLGACRAASMTFPGAPRSDEAAEIAALVAARPVEHHMVPMAPWEDIWDAGLLARSLDLGPRAHPGAQYERRFCEAVAARFGVTDHLSGHGADQLLWTTRALALSALIEQGRAAELLELWRAPRLRGPIMSAALRVSASAMLPTEVARLVRALLERWRIHRPVDQPWWSGHGWTRGVAAAPGAPGLSGWGWEQLQRGLLRRAEDAGVSMRSPFLDVEVWDAAASWGPAARMGVRRGHDAWLWDKLLLREALETRGALPAWAIWRPKLKTFDAVIARQIAAPILALSGEVARQPLRLAALGVIDQRAFGLALARYLAAPRGGAVWRTLAAEQWVRALEAR
jgi:asparagine synthetase B (glutamine-hydrolysing)